MLGVPCVTLRENMEWIETLEGGWNVLVGTDRGKIIEAVQEPVPTNIQQNMFPGESVNNKIMNVFEVLVDTNMEEFHRDAWRIRN